MQLRIRSRNIAVRRARIGHDEFVHPAYWIASTALIVAMMLRVPLGPSAAIVAATILFILGGLPHGAYDIALLRRTIALDRNGLVLATIAYAAIAAFMALLWMSLPLIALTLFLIVAAVHFGEDWQMLDEPLLRFAAGGAVIAAPAMGHLTDVAALFVQMSDGRAMFVAQIITAAAPVTLLVTAVGIAVAWREGNRQWAAAMTLCLALLLILPPVAGFALFFVFLHSPRHLAQTRLVLSDISRGRWIATGAILSGAAILGWWALHMDISGRVPSSDHLTAQAFQLLASVAVPHLFLSRWLEKRIAHTALQNSGTDIS